MNFEYSHEEKMLQESVKKVLKNKFPLTEVRNFIANENIPSNLTKLLAEQGLLGTTSWNKKSKVWEGVSYSTLIAYEAGRALIPFPLIENHVSAYLLSKYYKDSFLDSILNGEQFITIAWVSSEAHAKKEFDSHIVNGEFTYVPFANESRYMLANIVLEDRKEVMAIIDLHSEHISLVKRNSMDQTYPLYTVILKNYKVANHDLIGEIGEGAGIFDEMKLLAKLMISSEMVGICEEVLEITVNYANERKQFGQSISKFQAIKHMAADMYLLLECSKSALDYAICALESNSSEMTKVIALLKSYVSDAANQIVGTSIQIHGGIGYTWESDVHLYFKRARRSSIMLGDAYYHREQIAKYIESEILLTEVRT